MWITRPATITLAVLAVVAAAAPGVAQASVHRGAVTDAANGAPCVRTATPTGTDLVRADGSSRPAAYHHLALDGSTVTQVVAPKGWRPLHASDAQLRAFGFPQRPTGAAALSGWRRAAEHFRRSAPVGMCATDHSSTLTHTASSGNWAGGMTVNGTTSSNTYYDSSIRFTEPSFASGCGSSGYSIWSGLGGWNSNNGLQRLTQTGTDVSSGLNSVYVWWEMLTSAVGNPEVAYTGSSVKAGDSIFSDTYYSSGTLSFYVEDETTGVGWSTDESSYAGHAASYYYDGSTADAISEAPSVNGGIENLRKTSGTSIPYFTANGQALSHWHGWQINQVRGSDTVQTSSFNGANRWVDTWKSCA